MMTEVTSMLKQQKAEAVDRMRRLNMSGNAIRDFLSGKLMFSEQGFLFWLSDEAAIKAKEDFEKRFNAVVYHVIHNFTEFGELYSFLYVSKDIEEWEQDREYLANDFSYAYVYNKDEPHFSELGGIGIVSRYGGVVRTA